MQFKYETVSNTSMMLLKLGSITMSNNLGSITMSSQTNIDGISNLRFRICIIWLCNLRPNDELVFFYEAVIAINDSPLTILFKDEFTDLGFFSNLLIYKISCVW